MEMLNSGRSVSTLTVSTTSSFFQHADQASLHVNYLLDPSFSTEAVQYFWRKLPFTSKDGFTLKPSFVPISESIIIVNKLVTCFSCVQLFATLWTVAFQAPLSMGFSGRISGVGCHFLLQEIFPSQGSNLDS